MGLPTFAMQSPHSVEKPLPPADVLEAEALSNGSAPGTPGGPNRRRFPIAPLAIGAVVVLLALGLFFRSRQAAQNVEGGPGAAAEVRLRTVRTLRASTGTLVERLTVTGQLRANQTVNLGAEASGVVERVLVNEGQRVSRGQLLVTIDDDDLEQAVESAQANLRAAEVRLQQQRVGLPARVAQVNNAIDQAQSGVSSAEAQLASARARLRQAELNEPAQITATRSQVDSAQAVVESAQARVRQARDTARQTQQQIAAGIDAAEAALAQSRAQLQQVRSGARDQEVARAQAQVNLAEAQLRDAKTDLERQRTLYNGGAAPRANVDSAQTQVEVAQANVEAARQQLSLVREGARTEEVAQAEQVVAQREAALAQAQAERGRVLVAQSQVTDSLAGLTQAQEGLRTAQANLARIPITRQETRTAAEAVRVAEAGLETARSQLRQARANRAQIPAAQADIPAAEAAVQQARVGLQQAQVNLSEARVYAPISGVVTSKLTDAGQSVGPGTTLMTIVALDSVYFEAQVPESQIGELEVGQPANVTATAVSPRPISGYVSDVIPVADARLRQFRVRVTLENQRGLTPGAFARGVIQTNVVSGGLIVPEEVVRTDEGQRFVYLVESQGENAVIEQRRVRVGPSAGGRVQILGGLEPGDLIATGNATYRDGEKVRLSQERAATRPAE